ncbi:MAG: hypothetical protein ACRET7_00230 [Burkholderiales bacterium]
MRSKPVMLLKWAAVALLLAVAGLLGIRVWDSQRGPPLEVWHTYVPHDLKAAKIAKMEWGGYLEAEKKLFDEVRANVTEKLEAEARVPTNRYFDGSPIYPGKFATDWNRSYMMEPDGAPVGAVVLLHGRSARGRS